jgi:small nuclear ribonucleoprotein (snRNP)-like protein
MNKYQPEKDKVIEQILVMMKAQIIIYAILNHFDKAVKLALECREMDMAKQYANKPEDKKLKKKLWMKIAKHLFDYKGKKGKPKKAS